MHSYQKFPLMLLHELISRNILTFVFSCSGIVTHYFSHSNPPCIAQVFLVILPESESILFSLPLLPRSIKKISQPSLMLKGIELLFSQIKLLFFPIDRDNHITPIPAPLPGKKTHLLIHNAVRFLLQDVFSMNRFNLLIGHGLKPNKKNYFCPLSLYSIHLYVYIKEVQFQFFSCFFTNVCSTNF